MQLAAAVSRSGGRWQRIQQSKSALNYIVIRRGGEEEAVKVDDIALAIPISAFSSRVTSSATAWRQTKTPRLRLIIDEL